MTTNRGLQNIPGTSPKDVRAAARKNIMIYAMDAYNTNVGGSADIHSVSPLGLQENFRGKTTRGVSGPTFNMGHEALGVYSGAIIK